MSEDDTSEDHIARPQNTNIDVYKDIIQPMVAPMPTFPYNQATHSIRAFLQALGVSRLQFMSTLASKYQFAETERKTGEQAIYAAVTAEILGLQQEDYVAITGEGFYGDKETHSRLTAHYWSFENDKEMINALTNIKDGFLPATGLDFQELLSLLKTRYLNGALVIESIKPHVAGPGFTGHLEDMRLRQRQKDGTTEPLDANTCDKLHRFIRLKNKMKWSIPELDAAYFALWFPWHDPDDSDDSVTITRDGLGFLARLKQFSDWSGRSIAELLPLLGDMDTHGTGSLFARIFSRRFLSTTSPSIFDLDDNGELSKKDGKISENLHPIALALGVDIAELEDIKNVAMEEDEDTLSVNSLTRLYRVVLSCKILDIPPSLFEKLEVGVDSILGSYEAMRNYQELRSPVWSPDPWTIEQILFVTCGHHITTDARYNPTRQQHLEVTIAIQSGLLKCASDQATLGRASDKELATRTEQMLTQLFGMNGAQAIMDMMNKKLLSNDESLLFAEHLSPILGSDQTTTLFKKIRDDSELRGRQKTLLEDVSPVVAKARKIETILTCLRMYFPGLDQAVLRFLLTEMIDYGSTELSWLDILLNLGEASPVATQFEGFFLPPSTDTYTIACVAESPRELFIDGVQVDFSSQQSEASSSTQSKVNDAESNADESNQSKFTAVTDQLVGGQWHHLKYMGPITDLKWTAQHTIGVSPADFSRDILVSSAVVQNVSNVIDPLMRLSIFITRFHLSLAEVRFFHNTGRVILYSFDVHDIRMLERYTFLRDGFSRCGAKEPLMGLFTWAYRCNNTLLKTPSKKGTQPSLQEPIFQGLCAKLAAVTTWPSKLVSDLLLAKFGNISLFNLVNNFTYSDSLVQLHENVKFIKKLNLPELPLRTLFDMAIPARLENVKREFDHAAILRSAIAMRLSKPPTNNTPTALSIAHDEIRTHQRTALVDRLLSQEFKGDEYITDHNKLFRRLLIDVQMGPVLQTSRIKQAISTVQLFLQRCLLGAEKDDGIESKDLVGKADWTHLMRYRVWEASRKTGLYPENWIDPTLRDDKSEQFEAFESAVMQTNLDMDSITALVKDYVHSVNEVADLQVESYLWERENKASTDNINSKFHLFGRTRTAPFTFFYRQLRIRCCTMNIEKDGKEEENMHIAPYWSPWVKMDVDVPVIELDAYGKRLPYPGSYIVPAVHNHRLLVFLPDLVVEQQHSGAIKDDQTYHMLENEKLSESKPECHWKIRMSYTERQNGKWTPKRVSPSTIMVQPKYKELLDITKFQFWIEPAKNGSLRIFVEHVSEEVSYFGSSRLSRVGKCLGTFELRGHQLVVLEESELPTPTRMAPESQITRPSEKKGIRHNWILTEFSKLSKTVGTGETVSLESESILNDNKLWEPLLFHDRKTVDEKTQFNWLISFDDIDYNFPTGFVLEESTATNIEQWLAFPGPNWKPYMEIFKYGFGKEWTIDQMMERLAHFRNQRPLDDVSIRRLETMLENAQNEEKQKKEIEGHFNKQTLTNCTALKVLEAISEKDGLEPIYHCLKTLDKKSYSDAFGRLEDKDIFHELASPSAIYNWELAVHVPSLLMERLVSAQQYELAIAVGRLTYDPTTDDENDRWSFPPFRDAKLQNTTRQTGTPEGKLAKEEWHESNCNVHAAARASPAAYMKRFHSKYAEILVAMGDDYFMQNTLESVPFAIQMYTEALHVIGVREEVEMPRLGQREPKTFNDLTSSLDEWSNHEVDLKLAFPFYSKQSANSKSPGPFLHTDYFEIASNPYMAGLRNQLNDRLYKIRNGMDINGNKQRLALFEPPMDPGALVQPNGGARGGVAGLLSGISSPMPNYRFSYLIQHAFELVNELKASGQQFLSIKEKRDAEGLSLLRCKHQNVLLDLIKRVKQRQRTEVEKSIKVLEETRKQQEVRMQYYLNLTGDTNKVPGGEDAWTDVQQSIEPPSKENELRAGRHEQEAMDKAEKASRLNLAASIFEAVAGTLFSLPTFSTEIQPWGVGMSVSVGGNELGHSVSSKGNILGILAQAALAQGEQAGRKAGLAQQLQDRRMEINMAGHELMRIDKEMEQLRCRVDSCDADIEAQQKEVECAAAEEEWLRGKYTSQQLYSLLENTMGTLFHQTYLLANEIAKVARRALDFEHALRYPNSTAYTAQLNPGLGGYWENSRDGLLSGEALYLDLKRMEILHLENSTHDFEITKTISLRQLNPDALLKLRDEGCAEFTLPELLFDMDFPGHYCRRIHSVSVSIPCILGGFTSLNGTLTLLSHKYRVSSTAKDANAYTQAAEFHTDRIPITSIAVTSGVQESGTFNLDFNGNLKYGPFEGAGAISDWRLQFPKNLRQFDYNTITDAVLHLRYTSIDGGDVLAEHATNSAQNSLQNNEQDKKDRPQLAIDLINDYPVEWHRFPSSKKMNLHGLHRRFPYWTRAGTVTADQVTVVLAPKSNAATVTLKTAEKTLSNKGGDKPGLSEEERGQYKLLQTGNGFSSSVSDWEITSDCSGFDHAWLLIRYSFKPNTQA